jgi:uncharacterized membrane protein YciS (DUF1049 family)
MNSELTIIITLIPTFMLFGIIYLWVSDSRKLSRRIKELERQIENKKSK